MSWFGKNTIFESLYAKFPKRYGLCFDLEIQNEIYFGILKHVRACLTGNYLWNLFGYHRIPYELESGFFQKDITSFKNWFRSRESKDVEYRLTSHLFVMLYAICLKERLLCLDEFFDTDRDWSFAAFLQDYEHSLYQKHFASDYLQEYSGAPLSEWGTLLHGHLSLARLSNLDERLAISRGCSELPNSLGPIVDLTQKLVDQISREATRRGNDWVESVEHKHRNKTK